MVSRELGDLFSRRDRIDIRPVYQRGIRWTQKIMNRLIGTIMEMG